MSGVLQPLQSWPSPPALLPSVDCIRVLTVGDADDVTFRRFVKKTRRVGLWGRTTVQREAPDPEGGRVGCFRAHVRAWQAGVAERCNHLLVMEDDVFFDEEALPTWSQRAEALFRSRTPYDMLFMGFDLGWGDSLLAGIDPNATVIARATPHAGLECTYTIHDWRSTHAYIISRDAMRTLQNLTTAVGDQPIDFLLPQQYDRGRFVALRPKVAFQSFHESKISWAKGEEDTADSMGGDDEAEGEGSAPYPLANDAIVKMADNAMVNMMSMARARLSKQVVSALDSLKNDTEKLDHTQRHFEWLVSNMTRSRQMDEVSLYGELEPQCKYV